MEITKARYSVRPQKPRRKHLGVFFAVILSSVLLLSGGGYTFAALQKPLPPLTVSAAALAPKEGEKIKLPWPKEGQSAIGSLEDGVLASSNRNEQAKPIASMTKIVTALAVLEKAPFQAGDQGKTFTISAKEEGYFASYLAKDGSVVPVKIGQKITQYQAMQALLIISANNMADSLVNWTFGSMENYLEYANNMVKSYGLEHTTISDASGFSPKTVSTPSELIVLGQKALAQPVIKSIVAQKQATFPGYGTIRNTNRLLATDGVIGIKTGTTDEAGSCLLFASNFTYDKTHSTTIIGVIMGEDNGAAVVKGANALLVSAKKGFGITEVLPAESEIGQISSVWGQSTKVANTEPLKVYGWKGKSYQVQIELTESSQVLPTNTTIGKIYVVGNTTVTSELKTKTAISSPGTVWRLQNFW